MALLDLFANRTISPTTLFGTGADFWISGQNETGIRVDHETALSYSGIFACVRLLAGDISTLPLEAFRKQNGVRLPLRPKPGWIEEPDPFDPSITRIDHFAQVAISLLLDGNVFTRAFPNTFDPQVLTVLNPLRVEVKRTGASPEYHILNDRGDTVEVLTPLELVHVAINRRPGALRGMSPVTINAGSIGIGLAARKYVERFFGQGALTPGFVALPVEATDDQAIDVADKLKKRHRGWKSAGLLGVLSGGATFVKTGITPSEADLSALFNYQLEEGARIFGIPPFMVGSQQPAGVSYGSSVERAQHYIDHSLRHYLEPIEVGYRRLVPGGLDTYLKFNYEGLLRGDTKSRYEAHASALQNKWVVVDEVRRIEDLPPFGGLEGKFLETPNNNGPRNGSGLPLDDPAGIPPVPTAPAQPVRASEPVVNVNFADGAFRAAPVHVKADIAIPRAPMTTTTKRAEDGTFRTVEELTR